MTRRDPRRGALNQHAVALRERERGSADGRLRCFNGVIRIVALRIWHIWRCHTVTRQCTQGFSALATQRTNTAAAGRTHYRRSR
jgi:hypothetical protein